MNALVIYDTMASNTERVAQAIVGALGEAGQARAVRVGQAEVPSPEEVDLLVIGSPTQRRRPTPAIQALLDQLPRASLDGLAVAAFDTRYNRPRWMTGSAAHTIAGRLRKAGAVLVAPPASFYVTGMQGPLATGEIERAAAWGQTLRELFEATDVEQLTLRA